MNVLLPIADGFEEIEAVATIDVLRRAGINVLTVGIPGTMIRGCKGITLLADKKLSDIDEKEIEEDFDGIVLVGGYPGYVNLGKSEKVLDILMKMNKNRKIVAAICGAPSILEKVGLLNGKRATICPGMEREISRPRGEKVVQDDNVITSQGPGTAIDFALKIVENMMGKEKAKRIRREIVC